MVTCPHAVGPPLTDFETLQEDRNTVEVAKCPLAGTPRQWPHYHSPLSTHGPIGDIPALLTEGVTYHVVVNHNLHT